MREFELKILKSFQPPPSSPLTCPIPRTLVVVCTHNAHQPHHPLSLALSIFFFFIFYFLKTFSHLDFPAGGGRKHSGPQDKFFSVFFFFCFSTCCFPRQALIFSPFSFLTRPPPFYSNFFFFLSFFRFLSPCLLFLFSFRYFFSHHPPPISTFSNSIFADSTLNLSVIFQVGLLLFSFFFN